MNDNFPLTWHSRVVKRAIALSLAIILVIYVVIPNIHAFGLSDIKIFPQHSYLLIAAALIFSSTFILSSLSYILLAFKPLKLFRTSLIQFSSAPLHIVLPAGIGNLSINYLYLRTRHHNRTQAALVVGINNVTGVIANLTMLLVLFTFFGISKNLLAVYDKHTNWVLAISLMVILLAVVSFWLLRSNIRKIRKIRHHLKSAIDSYRNRQLDLIMVYIFALCQAAVTALTLYLCLRAYGVNLSYPLSFLVYSLSVLVGALVPTPGGLGGVEASLVAALVATHAASSVQALAIVLAYRLVSFWFPMLLGVVALIVVEKMQLIRWR